MATDDNIRDRVLRDLSGDAGLGRYADQLVTAAEGLASGAGTRVELLRLLQVASLDPEAMEFKGRGSLARVSDALVRAGVTGVAGGVNGSVRLARWAVDDSRGCPVASLAQSAGRPPAPDGAWPSRSAKEWKEVTAALAWDQGNRAWRDQAGAASVAPFADNTVVPALRALSTRSASTDAFVADLFAWLHARLDESGSTWETQTLWWSQALYSKSQSTSYRRLGGAARLFWMAHDLAQEAPARRHGGAEALFIETLRRLNESIEETRPASAWAAALLDAVDTADLAVSPRLADLVQDDPTLLPVTLLLVKRQGRTERTLLEVAPLLPDQMTLEDWAAQIFRERQLERWLGAEET